MKKRSSSSWPLMFSLVLLTLPAAAQDPEWIWHPSGAEDNQTRFFRKEFTLDQDVQRAVLTVAADNQARVLLNDERVAEARSWSQPTVANVTSGVRPGKNVLAIRARNEGSAAGLLVKLELTFPDKSKRLIVSDESWQTAESEQAQWTNARSLGKVGVQPWGEVFSAKTATSADRITTLPGFEVELLRSAQPGEGSWVSMTIDDKGRLILSPQESGSPMLRFEIDPSGDLFEAERIDLPVGVAMGLLYAFDSLYVNGQGPEGTGLYRLRDTEGNDQFDVAKFLAPMHGGGEHGPHGLALGPDDRIYVINGNHTKIPDHTSPNSPHQDYAEDQLLPRMWDGNGHARGVLAPGGYIARCDADGQNWELLLAGFRNAYDIAFNPDGEMFSFDSDMEWDWGMPWYRPTRINHCVLGAEFGWRSGSGKWPEYYPDSLPAVVDIGIGSPTGVAFGTGARFPDKYQRALYALDWTYGRILAVHLTATGASYRAEFETFVHGKPLNVTDLAIGQDGAMYFTTGGRGTQAGLYRVRYTQPGQEETVPPDLTSATARTLRRQLEAFQGRRDPTAVKTAWPHLNSPDRSIRYAARLAIESQPVSTWQDQALREDRPRAAVSALLALARKGPSYQQEPLLESLSRFWPDRLDRQGKLEATRIVGLSFTRMGSPSADARSELIDKLSPFFPTPDPVLNRELAQVLIFLEAPGTVQACLELARSATTQEDRLHYLFHLRTLKTGWSLERRREYFTLLSECTEPGHHPAELSQWFKDVDRDYANGASFPKFIENIRNEAAETMPEADRASLAEYIRGETRSPKPAAAQRKFVKEWSTPDLEPFLDQIAKGRSLTRGREALAAAQCLACHRFGNEGGATGQDLTAVASRYTPGDILDSILHPSKVVSEQYQNTTFYLKNDEDISGRIVDEKEGKWVVLIDPINDGKREIPKSDILRQEPAKLSPMPEGLINILSKEEILDLLAYLQSGGRAQ